MPDTAKPSKEYALPRFAFGFLLCFLVFVCLFVCLFDCLFFPAFAFPIRVLCVNPF
jgi:hypothetical protein